MKIYLVRHGETLNNVERRLTGAKDVALTERGIKQAEALSKRLEPIAFDLVLSSDLTRAVATAKIIVGNDAFVRTEFLRERSFGKFDGRLKDELDKHREESGLSRQEYHPPDGESYKMVEARIEKLWERFLSRAKGTVLVSAHGGLNRSFIRTICGLSYQEQFEFSQENTCLNILEGEQFGAFVPKLTNCTDHLAGLV